MKTREVFVAHGQLLDGNRVLILAFANRDEAEAELGRFESLQHKQTY